MERILWSVRKIDFFSKNMSLRFNGEKRFGTNFGGLISIIIYSLIIAMVFNGSSALFSRTGFKTTMTNIFFSEAPFLRMKELRMNYALRVTDQFFNTFNDPSYYKVEVSNFEVKRLENGDQSFSSTFIKIANCSLYYDYFMNSGFESDFKANDLKDGYCFNNENLILGGKFTGNYFSNIKVEVKKCKNSTDPDIICKSSREIDEKLKGAFFTFYYLENNIDLTNYTNPITPYFKDFFVLMDPTAKKMVDIYIKTVNISSDAGLIFEEVKYDSDTVFDYFREQIDTTSSDSPLFFYINSSNNKLVYSRVYLKFQDVAATVGGLLKVVLFVGSIMTFIITEYKMYEYMINTLFYVNDKAKGIVKENVKRELHQKIAGNFNEMMNIHRDIVKNHTVKEVVKFKGTSSNAIIPHSNESKFSLWPQNKLQLELDKGKSNKIEIGESLNPEIERKLNVSIREYKSNFKSKYHLSVCTLCSIFSVKLCCKAKNNAKYTYFKIVFNKLDKYLDYLKIIRTLQEIHKLKQVLLTKTQRKLFSSYNTPTIDESNVNKLKKKTLIGIEDNHNDYIELFKCFKKAKEKECRNKIYKKLLNNFDENLTAIFNQF